MSILKLTCTEPDCGKEFTLGQEAQDYIKRNGYDMPKRCKECREKKKARFNSPFKPALDHINRQEHGGHRA